MSGARVFVVEDEALIAMELRDRLERAGFEICGYAARGEQALAGLAAARPDVVVLDVNLGPGPDGFAVMQGLSPEARPAVVFLTAYRDEAVFDRAAEFPPSRVVAKPFDPRRLLEALAEVLEARTR